MRMPTTTAEGLDDTLTDVIKDLTDRLPKGDEVLFDLVMVRNTIRGYLD